MAPDIVCYMMAGAAYVLCASFATRLRASHWQKPTPNPEGIRILENSIWAWRQTFPALPPGPMGDLIAAAVLCGRSRQFWRTLSVLAVLTAVGAAPLGAAAVLDWRTIDCRQLPAELPAICGSVPFWKAYVLCLLGSVLLSVETVGVRAGQMAEAAAHPSARDECLDIANGNLANNNMGAGFLFSVLAHLAQRGVSLSTPYFVCAICALVIATLVWVLRTWLGLVWQ